MCRKKCFAKKNETFKTVRDSRDRNLESEVTLKCKDKTVVINMRRKDNKIYLVKIQVYGENITSDYLNNIVMITKASFGLDEVIK